MKIIAAFLFIVIAPGFAAAQRANNDGKPCGISHWSTTGAACEYAPDLPPFVDSELKLGVPVWAINDSLILLPHSYNYLLPDGYVPPPSPNPSLIFISADSLRHEMLRDPMMQQRMWQIIPDSIMRRLFPNDTSSGVPKLKPLQKSPDPMLPH
jgi:hypothetical protein